MLVFHVNRLNISKTSFNIINRIYSTRDVNIVLIPNQGYLTIVVIRLGREQLAPGKKLLHVRFLIDEFANIGKIANFEEALAIFRKREMSFMVILQSLAQLKKMYKNNWEEIVDNCASLIYLGGDDPKTFVCRSSFY